MALLTVVGDERAHAAPGVCARLRSGAAAEPEAPHPPTRIGVISNTRSRRNRRGMTAVRAVLANHPGTLHAELDRIGDVGGVLEEFARREVDLVVVNGGDGSVQATLTALFNDGAFERPPLLAVVPAGGANLIARDVGLKGSAQHALARVLARAPGGDGTTRLVRSVLSVTHDPGRRPVHGMFFGAAAFYWGTAFAHEALYPRGIGEPLAAAVSLSWWIVRSMGARLRPNPSDPRLHGEPMTIAADGEPGAERRYLLVIATTLRRLMFGLTPFWGGGDGRIRYTTIASPARRPVSALLPVLRGRPRPWLAESGYRSGAADRLALAMAEPMVVDGEILAPAPGAPVVLESDRRAAFLRC